MAPRHSAIWRLAEWRSSLHLQFIMKIYSKISWNWATVYNNFIPFAQFHNFSLLLLHYSKFNSRILDPNKFKKFWIHNPKRYQKTKKSIFAFTRYKLWLSKRMWVSLECLLLLDKMSFYVLLLSQNVIIWTNRLECLSMLCLVEVD
jgi:hypothetical protein